MTDDTTLLDDACDDLLTFLRVSTPRQTEAVSRLGFTLHQFRALVTLEVDDRCTTTQLAAAIGVNPSVATGIVQRMVDRGYITRLDDASDRRMKRLSLTDHGRQLAEEVVGTARVQRRAQLSALNPTQLAALRDILGTLLVDLKDPAATVD